MYVLEFERLICTLDKTKRKQLPKPNALYFITLFSFFFKHLFMYYFMFKNLADPTHTLDSSLTVQLVFQRKREKQMNFRELQKTRANISCLLQVNKFK